MPSSRIPVTREPAGGKGAALDLMGLVPGNAMGSGSTGTAATSLFLRADRSWAAPPGGAGGGINLAASNTTYTSGTVTITGVGAGVTVNSNTGQRVDISIQPGVSAIVATNTTYTANTLTLTGSNMVTVKSSALGAAIIFDATQSVQTQNAVDLTLAGNTSGALALVSSGTATLAGGNNITLSQAGNAITISAGAGGGGASISHWKLVPGGAGQQTITVPNAQMYVVPIFMPANLTGHTARIFISAAGASGSSAQVSWSVNVYTKTGTKISSVSSASSSSSWTSNTVAAGDWLGVSGQRRWDITNANFSFTPGDYVIGIWHRSTNAGTYNYIAQTGLGNAISGKLGAVSNTSMGHIPGAGAQSVTTAAMPATLAYSDMQNWPGSNQKPPDFAFLHSSYSDV